MKKYWFIIKWFTFIELVIVISIITLIWFSWVFYFNDFVKKTELENKLNTLKDDLLSLDKNIENYKISDYELNFNTSTWTLWYTTYINNFDLNNNQYINFNSNTWSWIIWTNWWLNDSWKIKLYKKHKLFVNETNSWNYIMNFNFNTEPYYKIYGSFSWETLNDINVSYFNEENLYPEKNNLLKLTSINTKIDKTWTNLTSLKITNIWWSKNIYWDWIKITNAFLFFELNDKENYIEVK